MHTCFLELMISTKFAMHASYGIEYFVIFGILSLFFWLFYSWHNNPYRDIPGPPGWPIIGNTLDFSGSTDQHALLLSWVKKYGRIFKYYVLFGGYRIHITDPVIAKHILVTNSKNYRRQDVLKRLLPGFGSGLITANGRAHATQRRQLNPFFSLANVQRFFPVFVQKTNELMKHWTQELSHENNETMDCDVLDKLTHLSLDVVGICAFGYHFNCIIGGHNEESKATDAVLRGNFDLQRRSLEELFPPLKMIPSKIQRNFLKAEACLQSLIERVIKQRRTCIENQKGFISNDLLGILFSMEDENGVKISAKDIYHQVFTFLISGHETTSLTTTWTLYMLAKHPEVQTELRKEIMNVFGANNRELEWQDLDKMKILDHCIKEAMRLYPVAITTDRTAIGPDKLGPYTITPGTHVAVGTGSLHRDVTFWTDPDKFNPSRFDEIGASDAKFFQYQFLPFSRGPRMCIGYRFATAEIKVILSKILRNFTFSIRADEEPFNDPDCGISSISTLTLKPFPRLSLKVGLVN